tara:strand:- start:620 stop:1453 length:834 start_codon:yes stop_codon:yes gene_type:complete
MEPSKTCEGAILDMAHGMSLYQNKALHLNDEELFLHADFIFFTAGATNTQGNSRLSIVNQNIQLSKEIFEPRTFTRNTYIIVITNPVDIISHSVQLFSGLPAENVIGTGTFLDSMRLEYYLSTLTPYQPTDFKAIVLGEHGASQVPIYSMTKLNGQPILSHSALKSQDLELAASLTRNAAFEIRKTQKATTYGVSKCAATILDYLLGDEQYTIPLSVLTNEYFRKMLNLDHDIYISLPVIVNKGKIEINSGFEFTNEELNSLRKSAAILASIIKPNL